MAIMVALAVIFGLKNKNADEKVKNKVLIAVAILIDSFELFKIVFMCFRASDPWLWRYELPLFLCSIQLIAIPLAAFSSGSLKEAARDFVMIFGILGAVFGTYFAGQNYGCYPVLSFDNVISGVTHSMSGFASLYIMISRYASMKKKNMLITFGILIGFCVFAYIANVIIDYNYMFLVRGDGTPYDIFFNLVGGNPVLYPMVVVALFLIYIAGFYGVYYRIKGSRKSRSEI
jgi:uncharacterized membrane protein YwaF